MTTDLSDKDLEKNGWFEVRDFIYQPAPSPYESAPRIHVRILTMEKP